MTAQEKAKELVDKMLDKQEYSDVYQERGIISWSAKQCALIAVEFAREFITGDLNEQFDKILYLIEIKEEIEKL
ncbi:hypothetical protein UFOVP391_4 [uncultured Caudovirales phage]|uniref:Uncharacterized protein n=1 Tax=uncultured Caudovirales phage TaxID=2100421 RepID=A0A6J7X3W6_9CAUD|nr:hypothetical protein UFOVP391_4 [uncultured Caudovirales phage]